MRAICSVCLSDTFFSVKSCICFRGREKCAHETHGGWRRSAEWFEVFAPQRLMARRPNGPWIIWSSDENAITSGRSTTTIAADSKNLIVSCAQLTQTKLKVDSPSIVRVVKCVLKKMCNSMPPPSTYAQDISESRLKGTRRICNEPIKVTGGCEDDDEEREKSFQRTISICCDCDERKN